MSQCQGFGVFLAVCLWLSSPLHAQPLLAQVQAQLEQAPVLRGQFVQTRTLLGVAKPLLSKGRFIVDRKRGVLWITETPFPNILRIKAGEILQKDGERVLMRLSAKNEPAVKTIASVLFAVFAGDLAQLDRHFQHRGSLSAGKWQLELTPRASAVAKLISSLELKGAKHVESVLLRSQSQDLTRVDYSAQVAGSALSDAERRAFE